MTEQTTLDSPATAPTETDSPPESQPRDGQGRFTTKDDSQDEGYRPGEDPDASVDDTEGGDGDDPSEVNDESDESPESTSESAGLDLESEDAPVYDHEGKFVGGKFLGKYDTLDDQLKAHRHAVRETARLQRRVKELEESGVPDDGSAFALKTADDPSDDELSDLLMKEMKLGDDGELSLDDRISYEENPAKWMAQNMTKAMKIYNRLTSEKQGRRLAWAKSVQKKYTEPVNEASPSDGGYGWTQSMFDQAVSETSQIWPLIVAGKMSSREVRALLGVGLMYRARKLTLANPAAKRKSGGRSPEVEGSRPTPSEKRKTEREEDVALRQMQEAAYG